MGELEDPRESCTICTGTRYQSNGFAKDLRTLTLSNMYQLDEKCDRIEPAWVNGLRMYQITTCKECRGEFIELLWKWANGEFFAGREYSTPNANIHVRRAGRDVTMTLEEFIREQSQRSENANEES